MTLQVALLRHSPLQPLTRWMHRQHLRVLAYHAVEDGPRFESQMDHLVERYSPVSLDQVMAAIEGEPLPRGAVLVTFDDGHRSWVETAAPAMMQRRIPGVVFVVSGALDSSTPYWWEQVMAILGDSGASVVRRLKTVPDSERIEQLAALLTDADEPPSTRSHLRADDLAVLEDAGLEIGNHTVTHPLLDKCEPEQASREIADAKSRLEQIVGHRIRSFAFPNGNWDSATRALVASADHDLAFTFDHRIQVWPPGDPFTISRIRVNAHDPLDVFAVRVSGLHPAVHRIRGGS